MKPKKKVIIADKQIGETHHKTGEPIPVVQGVGPYVDLFPPKPPPDADEDGDE